MCILYLNSLLTTYTNGGIVIVGDFNESILNKSRQKYIHSFLTGNGFIQHIQEPTTEYGSLLDDINTRDMYGLQVDVQDCCYSDHNLTFCLIKVM